MEKTRKNKGITLVALVITIVILLILAGISIQAITNTGLFENAKRAAAVHLFFNISGTVIFMVVFYTLNTFVHFSFLNTAASPAGIAVIHSLFNIGATILLFPFLRKWQFLQFQIKDLK